MTTVITRYFDSASKARDAWHELVHRERFPLRILRMFEQSEGLVDALTGMQIPEDTARAYEKKMSGGGAVIMVLAGYKPLGVAKIARTIMAQMGAADMGDLVEEALVPDTRPPTKSILRDHRHFLLRRRDPYSTSHHMADWPIGLISRRKPFKEMVFEPHQRMANWPIDLLLPGNKRYGRFPFDYLVPGHRFQAKFPFGHLVPHNRRFGRFPFGFLVPHSKRYGRFPFGFLVPHGKRYGRFPFDFLIRNGRRMASWPFPLLINGKQGGNALIPGHKYQAKFPFDHLVPHEKRYGRFPFGFLVSHNRRYGRFPFGLLVPGHKFMAKFPFGHIVPGHKHYAKFPIDHLVPGHKYMANFIFPHTKT